MIVELITLSFIICMTLYGFYEIWAFESNHPDFPSIFDRAKDRGVFKDRKHRKG